MEEEKLIVSETYIVGIDISEHDPPMMMITKYKNAREIIHVNTICGDEAIKLYKILKGESL